MVTQSGAIVSASHDHTLRLWRGGECKFVLEGHTDIVWCVDEVAPDVVASGSDDSTVRLWKVVTGELLETLYSHTAAVTAVARLPGGDGVPLFVSGSDDRCLKVWKKGGAKDGWFITRIKEMTGRVNALTVLSDGTIVAGTSADEVTLWRV